MVEYRTVYNKIFFTRIYFIIAKISLKDKKKNIKHHEYKGKVERYYSLTIQEIKKDR